MMIPRSLNFGNLRFVLTFLLQMSTLCLMVFGPSYLNHGYSPLEVQRFVLRCRNSLHGCMNEPTRDVAAGVKIHTASRDVGKVSK